MPATRQTRSELKRDFARYLRAHATEVERQCWALLRGKQIAHLRFRRQQPIGPYIVDFFCPSAKLIVELDGDQHGANQAIGYDAARTRWLEARGYCVLRFANGEFLKNKAAALERILIAIENRKLPLPEPPLAVRPSLKGRVD